jgi:predicted nuclease of predicted toxin-antitoxin system
MKLLLDQNLSSKLCRQLIDLFPGSNHVRLLGLAGADDRKIWLHAKANDFVLISYDAYFADMATLYGPPPKVIWLRCCNQPTEAVESRFRDRIEVIADFGQSDTAACWEIY